LKALLVLNEFKEFAEKKFTRMGCNHFCISQPTSSLPLTPLSKVLTPSKIYLAFALPAFISADDEKHTVI